jgi:hypothetical protein
MKLPIESHYTYLKRSALQDLAVTWPFLEGKSRGSTHSHLQELGDKDREAVEPRQRKFGIGMSQISSAQKKCTHIIPEGFSSMF